MEIALTSDGARLVSGSQDGTLRVWLTKARKCLYTLTDHKGKIWTVAVSPDSRRALSGGDDKILRLWELDTGKLLKTYEGHGDPIWAVAFTPDGTLRALRWRRKLRERVPDRQGPGHLGARLENRRGRREMERPHGDHRCARRLDRWQTRPLGLER